MMATPVPRKVSIIARSRAVSDVSTCFDEMSPTSTMSNISTPPLKFDDEPMKIELSGYTLPPGAQDQKDIKNDFYSSTVSETAFSNGDGARFQRYLKQQNELLEQENAMLLMRYSTCLQYMQQGIQGGPPGLPAPEGLLPHWVQAQPNPQADAIAYMARQPRRKSTGVSDVDTAVGSAGSEILSEGDDTCDSDGTTLATGEQRTSAMLRNIPNCYTRQLLLKLMDDHGFAGQYDFVYLPIDFKTQLSLGYCFINFVNTEVASEFLQHFQGFCNWAVPSHKVARLNWCDSQGLKTHIDRYKNSSIMQDSVPDEYKPVLLFKGNRIPFPLEPREAHGRKGSKGKAVRKGSK